MESNILSLNQKSTVLRKLKTYSSTNDTSDFMSYATDRQNRDNILKRKYVESKEKNLMYGNVEDNESSDVTELTTLRTRGASSNVPSYMAPSSKHASDIVILERDILPSDTLQSFALLYGCTLNDLKRANNLIKEQEFFALRRIKIPVKKFGLLTEPEEELKRRPGTITSSNNLNVTSTTTDTLSVNDNRSKNTPLMSEMHEPELQDDTNYSSNDETSHLLQPHSPILSKTTAVEHNDATKFLKNVDKEIRNTVKKSANAAEKSEVLEEVVSSLGSVGFQPLPLPGTKKMHDCDGATWGLKWSTVMLSFAFGLALVILFILIKSLVGL